MNILDTIMEKAKTNPQRVAFPECCEEKILQAARECADKKICIPYLVGTPKDIQKAAEDLIFHWMIWLFMMLQTAKRSKL